MRDRKPHRSADRLNLKRAEGKGFGLQLWPEFVAPLEPNPLRPLEFENLSGVRHPPVREDHLPLCSRPPFRLDMHSEPVLLHLVGIGQRRPQLFRRRADEGYIDEAALSCLAHDSFPSNSFFSFERACSRGCSNLRIQRSAISLIGTGL